MVSFPSVKLSSRSQSSLPFSKSTFGNGTCSCNWFSMLRASLGNEVVLKSPDREWHSKGLHRGSELFHSRQRWGMWRRDSLARMPKIFGDVEPCWFRPGSKWRVKMGPNTMYQPRSLLNLISPKASRIKPHIGEGCCQELGHLSFCTTHRMGHVRELLPPPPAFY